MICSNCQNELREGTKFCRECGMPAPEQTIGHTNPGTLDDNPSIRQSVQEDSSFVERAITRLGSTGRQTRLPFFLNMLGIWVIQYLSIFVIGFQYFFNNPYAPEDAIDGLIYLMLIPGYVLSSFQMVRRLHDFGRSAWHLLTFLIPFWNLYEWFKLFFITGEDGLNIYD